MRLLNTSTLQLKEYFDSNIPPYAILSHRWENEEVTFQDMQRGSHEGMAGFLKIKGCCRQAELDGFAWVWIDSCCIDKSSSSELSEAINSMFRWYQDAEVCYAFLSDVPSAAVDHRALNSTFRRSKLFTRGWTLQESLTPAIVVFFNEGWVEIGTRSSLEKLISEVTTIRNISRWKDACIAQKMSCMFVQSLSLLF
jgi:Heterokaryon incompatibility protein (HET)